MNRASVGRAPTGPGQPFWTWSVEHASRIVHGGVGGLTSRQARARLAAHGANVDVEQRKRGMLASLGLRFLEPLSLILLVAAAVSGATGDATSATMIVVMLALSVGLDALQEHRARRAAEQLRRSVALHAEVKRDGAFVDIPSEAVVQGDVVRVRTGDIVPADALVLESAAFTAGEAALTGEPYPVEKRPGVLSTVNPAEASNALFRGSVGLSGEAVGLVVETGRDTLFGGAAAVLAQSDLASPFQRDLRGLGMLIARMTVALVVIVVAAHVLSGRPALQSLMFAVALAVGLTPELLPMVTTVTLARGALRLAKRKVIVKRLASIHDLGAMTVLCVDKTGTLTAAEITLARSCDLDGADNARPAELGARCALLAGDRGALDAALSREMASAADGWRALGRQPFDFQRRIGAVLAEGAEGRLLIAKGAPEAVLGACALARRGARTIRLDARLNTAAAARVRSFAEAGMRVVAVASKPAGAAATIAEVGEGGMTLEGFCVFSDPPKASAREAVARLAAAGVRLVVLSGDDPLVVRRVAAEVGLEPGEVLVGGDLAGLDDDALRVQAGSVGAYGRLTPDQKSRIVRALQAGGEIVGFMGDGVNDAPGIKTADVGLSVDGASGVARSAADMILLDSDLAVVADGVEEGRRTFVNIVKYVRMGASSNFGNMLSMAAASLFLPFLPMLPTQILLNNLLYDLSEAGIPFDRVGSAAVARPVRWDMKGVVRFAAVMGPLSSLFDLATFAGLIWVFHAPAPVFRTAWFLESIVTQVLVIFVIRSSGPAWKSLPHPALAASSLGALAVAIAIPFSPLGVWFGFVAPKPAIVLAIAAVAAAYLLSAEVLKRFATRSPGGAAGLRADPASGLRAPGTMRAGAATT
ncbi:MAG: magnesium-translocating P-type ATPase [Proteobacteria bacterium]|nr:magnesium-translocating P-type ATPase [Pseudomonadota bacterium]